MKDHEYILLLPLILLLISPSCVMPASAQGSDSIFTASGPDTWNTKTPFVLSLQDGGFFVIWAGTIEHSNKNAYDLRKFDYDIYGRIYNADETARSPEFIINSKKDGFQGSPSLLQLPNSNVMVVWRSEVPSTTLTGQVNYIRSWIRCFIKPEDGTKEGEELVLDAVSNTTATSTEVARPYMTLLDDGRVILSGPFPLIVSDSTWTTFKLVTNTPTSLNNAIPATVPANSRGFTVVWGDTVNIYMQLYNSTNQEKTNTSSLVSINNTSTGGKSYNPTVKLFPDGSVLVAWGSTQPDSSGISVYSIKGRLYDQDGEAIGPEFIIAEEIGSKLGIMLFGDGNYIVTWGTVKGIQYDVNHTTTGELMTLFNTDYASSISDLSFTPLKNYSVVAAGSDNKERTLKAFVFTPGKEEKTTPTSTKSDSEGSTNIELIIGFAIPCTVVFVLICLGIQAIRKRRSLKRLNKKAKSDNPNQETVKDTEAQLQPDQQATDINSPSHQLVSRSSERDVQNTEPIQIRILGPEDFALKLISSGDKNAQLEPEEPGDENCAPQPEISVQETRKFLLDGRKAKQQMSKLRIRTLSGEPFIQKDGNLDSVREPLDPTRSPRDELESLSAVRDFILDGRQIRGTTQSLLGLESQREGKGTTQSFLGLESQRENLELPEVQATQMSHDKKREESDDEKEEDSIENLFMDNLFEAKNKVGNETKENKET